MPIHQSPRPHHKQIWIVWEALLYILAVLEGQLKKNSNLITDQQLTKHCMTSLSRVQLSMEAFGIVYSVANV